MVKFNEVNALAARIYNQGFIHSNVTTQESNMQDFPEYKLPDDVHGPVPFGWVSSEKYLVCGAGDNPMLGTTAWSRGSLLLFSDTTMVWYKLNPDYTPVNTKQVTDAAKELAYDIQDAINRFTAKVTKDN
jgi:hypothetical protein